MIIGLTTENWIEQLELKQQDEYLDLIDSLVIVTDTEFESQPPYYFVKGDYSKIYSLLKELSLCKAYPQKTLFSVNYSLVEIPEGMTPKKLKEVWVNELKTRNLV